MKYTQVDNDIFKQIQFNAGVLCKNFNFFTGEVSDIIGATTGGISVAITPSTTDYGEDIDNVKKNTYQLKKIDSWEAKFSGTFVAAGQATIKRLLAAADASTPSAPSGTTAAYTPTLLTPRAEFNIGPGEDFTTVWWVGDYTDDNSDSTGKFIAIRLDSALNTAGFSLKTSDKAKGQFSFEFLAHYSLTNDAIPFAVYVVENTTTTTSG